jgi:Protein of unknown function (DUF3499)
MRLCSKPGCHHPASALLGYEYATKIALLTDALDGDVSPHLYALCPSCADRLIPPRGWLLEDRRTAPPLFLAGETTLV